ncbi:magnesium transporter [Phlyctochytrium arcticum]|nr:magnesium transporter [Phlyctochytrium arcticum]
MANWIARGIYTIGAAMLLHAGYSAFEHTSYIKTIHATESHLPLDIIIECLIGLFLSIIGVTLVAGPLKDIDLTREVQKLTMDAMDYRPSFRPVNHRGTVMLRTS